MIDPQTEPEPNFDEMSDEALVEFLAALREKNKNNQPVSTRKSAAKTKAKPDKSYIKVDL